MGLFLQSWGLASIAIGVRRWDRWLYVPLALGDWDRETVDGRGRAEGVEARQVAVTNERRERAPNLVIRGPGRVRQIGP